MPKTTKKPAKATKAPALTTDALLAIAGTPVERDERICFGIHYFDTELKANAYAEYIVRRGDTYNGGWYHGMACGRDEGWDYTTKAGTKLYAVTVG